MRAVETFARGLAQDGAAVRAALTTPWSNGQTEGHHHAEALEAPNVRPRESGPAATPCAPRGVIHTTCGRAGKPGAVHAAAAEATAPWQARRNAASAKVTWRFTTDAARTKLARLYPALPS